MSEHKQRDTSGGHFVEFWIDSYSYLSTRFECREPDTKECHQIVEDEDGVPTTRVATCNFVEWMEEMDTDLESYAGSSRRIENGPIRVWAIPQEQGYVWTFPGDEPED